MHKLTYVFISSGIAAGVLGAFTAVAFAQTAVDAAHTAASSAAITYPIIELGSCTNKQSCKTYCDQSDHMQACVVFAEKRGLLRGEDLRVSKIVAEKIATKQTPGGCTSQASCEAYCNGNAEHLNACLAFGEQLGVIPKAELEEARKIALALTKGATLPGSCKTKNECERYCAVGAHIDECLNFAEASGILPPDQLAEARKVAPFLRSGETPGKCDSKASCEAYCADNSHFTECLGFAEKAGFVSADDAALARKTGGKGPGGCTSQVSCESYCADESHAAECIAFAKEKGLLTKQQQELVDTGIDQLNTALSQLPEEVRPEIMTCLQSAAGNQDKLNRLLSKQEVPTRAVGDKIQACFAHVDQIVQKAMMAKYRQGVGIPGAPGGGVQEGALPAMPPGNVPPAPGVTPSMPAIPPGVNGQPPIIPAGVPIPTPSSITGGTGADICAAFSSIPSCDYVPAGAARDACLKCK